MAPRPRSSIRLFSLALCLLAFAPGSAVSDDPPLRHAALAADDVFNALQAFAERADAPVVQAQAGGQAEEEPQVNGRVLILPPDEDVIYFDQPIGFGPFPVNGKSIAQLIQGTPLFPPIEGLDKSLWEKTCSNCHKWNRERLCEQGKSYAGLNTRLILRHPHPYGGPFKLALKRWAEKGCL